MICLCLCVDICVYIYRGMCKYWMIYMYIVYVLVIIVVSVNLSLRYEQLTVHGLKDDNIGNTMLTCSKWKFDIKYDILIFCGFLATQNDWLIACCLCRGNGVE